MADILFRASLVERELPGVVELFKEERRPVLFRILRFLGVSTDPMPVRCCAHEFPPAPDRRTRIDRNDGDIEVVWLSFEEPRFKIESRFMVLPGVPERTKGF